VDSPSARARDPEMESLTALEASYRYCRQVARREARNFYYSFLLLPRSRRDAMCAIYAFMRACDDLSDDPEQAGAGPLRRWREDLHDALAGHYHEHPCWPAFHDTVRRFRIPAQYFDDMIDGVTSDLEPRIIETFDELYAYCYRVASVVGLTIVHIFGFESPRALELAEKCGIAFQLTNILRDVREDCERGRIYLPAEDLRRFNLTAAELCDPAANDRFRDLMRFEAARARAFYEASAPLVGIVERHSRPSLRALIGIYRRLLERIEQSNYDVLARRIRLPAWEKVWILMRAVAA
jgi:15-cis-phytoene synthase